MLEPNMHCTHKIISDQPNPFKNVMLGMCVDHSSSDTY